MQFQICDSCHRIVLSGPPVCMLCGTDFSFQPTDNFLRDVVTRYQIRNTEIWIFPTCIFKCSGMDYWLQARGDGGHYPFAEVLGVDDDRCQTDGHLCDALVDSANNFLIAGSGVARCLDEQMGESYGQAKRALLESNSGELLHGQAYFLPLSRPFGRVLKGVIEAISIRYRLGDRGLSRIPSSDLHIRGCVHGALLQAHENECRSLAIPQMASRPGYSIYGPELAPAVMVGAALNAIVSFLSEVTSTSVQRICLHPADLAAEQQMVLFFARLGG